MDISNYVFAVAAGIMLLCLYMVIRLRKEFSGGIVGKYWKYLSFLVALFTAGYLALPFFGDIPEHILRLTVAGVFLFGAIYVFLTIKLVRNIIKALS